MLPWLIACAAPLPIPNPTVPATAAAGAAPLAFVQSGAGPLVVVVHGRGDVPESMRDALSACGQPIRVLAPRGPTPLGDGFEWFPKKLATDGSRVWDEAAIRARADELAATIRAESPTGKAVITGFSQGAILSFAVAMLHPEVVSRAVPVAGALPEGLVVTAPRDAPLILAFHGLADDVLPAAPTQALIQHLVASGWDARLTTYPDVRHEITPGIHRDWCQAVVLP